MYRSESSLGGGKKKSKSSPKGPSQASFLAQSCGADRVEMGLEDTSYDSTRRWERSAKKGTGVGNLHSISKLKLELDGPLNGAKEPTLAIPAIQKRHKRKINKRDRFSRFPRSLYGSYSGQAVLRPRVLRIRPREELSKIFSMLLYRPPVSTLPSPLQPSLNI